MVASPVVRPSQINQLKTWFSGKIKSLKPENYELEPSKYLWSGINNVNVFVNVLRKFSLPYDGVSSPHTKILL